MPKPDLNINELIELRHTLHQHPELSGEEEATANRIAVWLKSCAPDHLFTNLGGPGVAAVYDSQQAGPTVLFRCELDALPIFETGQPAWRSTRDGYGHLCGHDGHMAIVCGLARHVAAHPPKAGRVVLLFQPAEENGTGAQAVIADPQFQSIKPDYAFALHNLPGMPLHEVGVKPGPFNFASEGLAINLTGRTSHASHPEDGISPAPAVSALIDELPQLPAKLGYDTDQALLTLVHASVGERAFGVAPGNGLVMATLRAIDNEVQAKLMDAAVAVATEKAKDVGLEGSLSNAEKFAACTNDAEAVTHIERATKSLGITTRSLTKPFRWSEDFGLFSDVAKSALFVLGAGEHHSQLHNPDYDFPDALIETGISMFAQIADQICSDTP